MWLTVPTTIKSAVDTSRGMEPNPMGAAFIGNPHNADNPRPITWRRRYLRLLIRFFILASLNISRCTLINLKVKLWLNAMHDLGNDQGSSVE